MRKKAKKVEGPRLPRLPKRDSIDLIRDRGGEVMLRCRFCNKEHTLKEAWLHTCPRNATGVNNGTD